MLQHPGGGALAGRGLAFGHFALLFGQMHVDGKYRFGGDGSQHLGCHGAQ